MSNYININRIKLVRERKEVYAAAIAISCPDDAVDMVKAIFDMEYLADEVVVALFLDCKNNVIGTCEIGHGTIDACILQPRDIFKAALLHNAASLMLFHNHPSGNPQPSMDDINSTKRIVEAGRIIGINVLDHIIIGDHRYYSLKEYRRM